MDNIANDLRYKIKFENLVKGKYSSLPNRRIARNKRCGGSNEPFLISVAPRISVVAGKISHFLLAWCLE